jgi:squalene-hopene/tetraprenyl-beta-curcumene cyclase
MKMVVNCGLVSLLTLASGQAAPQDFAAEPAAWNRESAAAYLDGRMDAWFSKSKKLMTGEGETACVSCHTSLPYSLSRPFLRRTMGVAEPTPQEVRLLEEVARRVDTYESHQVLYDFNERKKAESRGTEAVLNVVILTGAAGGQNRREVEQKAFRRLWEAQRPDGAWDWLDFGLEPFESADAVYHGAALAALAAGSSKFANQVPGTTEGLEKLRSYLRANYASQNLFNRTWLLLASTRLKDLMTMERSGALIDEIRGRQRIDGGWSLESLGVWRWSKAAAPYRAPGEPDASLVGKSDAYATGLVVFSFLEAGLSAKHPSVEKGLRWLEANQQVSGDANGGWRAHSLNFDRENGGEKGEPWRRMFMSDAATALAVMALTEARERERRQARE